MKLVVISVALLFATPIAHAAPRDRVTAAASIYAAALADWEGADAKSTLADVHAWSVRWLEAELAVPVRGAARRRAFADHLARMTEVEQTAQTDESGGLIGSELALQEATFFREEAERWQAANRIL